MFLYSVNSACSAVLTSHYTLLMIRGESTGSWLNKKKDEFTCSEILQTINKADWQGRDEERIN